MSGNTKDINDSRTEVLQALLNSLSPEVTAAPSSKLSPLQLKHLADKIDEVLGGGGDSEGAQRNEKGELVNDEGLPIIDISEPAADTVDVHSITAPFHEPDLIPVSTLSALEMEERRRTRDHILDMLEEEERIQLERDEEEEKERQRNDIRKRKEAAKAEMERLRAAKEMQKKMGKALLKNLAEAREKEERERKDLAEKEPPKSDPSKPKKTVTFANPPLPDELSAAEERQTATSSIDWGDITPARLRSINRAPLITRADEETHPMRRNVVERHPASYKPSSEPPSEGDSDDEPLSTSSLAHDEYGNTLRESCNLDSDADDDDISDEDVLAEEYDWDSAHHHREVALEYYKKRHVIGAEAARAMTSHTHDDEEWNEANIPPDQRPKPSVSRFRADHMAAAYDRSTSTSLGPTVIPASRQKSLQEAIKVGKLDNNQLVGGEEGESGSEDETVREVLELLKNGRIENAGPDFVAQPAQSSDALSLSAPPAELATTAPKPSKFRTARRALASDQPSQSSSPLTVGEGSSPKSPVSEVVERRQFKPNRPHQRAVEPPFTVQPIPSMTTTVSSPPFSKPAVVDSPSFPSMIVDSPSFPRRTQPNLSGTDTSRPQRPPVIMRSAVMESNGGSARSTSDTGANVPEGRISRFKAERM
ncbi:hypothetical protein K503DRAFT_863414 [Rhizopogon vinicolor AM-OR11-026]|uniref:DUF3835 domain-containing protein n=1 Tax=Rhizopogon vinicolor AM-OR11-026 TaxID=1314800 RepID=A0A1B7NAV8_9AGAM|nr:hypothetical protein K503DRAFT_863414 [Rhizopogon vinicolor AM-OR11-026]